MRFYERPDHQEQSVYVATGFATELGSTRRDERRRRPRNCSKRATDWELKGQAGTCRNGVNRIRKPLLYLFLNCSSAKIRPRTDILLLRYLSVFYDLYIRRVPGKRPAWEGWPVHIPRGVEVLLRSARKIFSMLRCKAVATRETNESISAKPEAIRESAEALSWCPGAEVVISNISMGCFPNPAPNVPLFSIGFYQHFPNRRYDSQIGKPNSAYPKPLIKDQCND